MAKFWVRGHRTGNPSVAGHDTTILIYDNQIEGTAIKLKQEATAVFIALFCVSDNVDLMRARLLVMHEDDPTPVDLTPPIDDSRNRGVYPFCLGPVLYTPSAAISIPPEHKLHIQFSKVTHTATSIYNLYFNFLIVTGGL